MTKCNKLKISAGIKLPTIEDSSSRINSAILKRDMKSYSIKHRKRFVYYEYGIQTVEGN